MVNYMYLKQMVTIRRLLFHLQTQRWECRLKIGVDFKRFFPSKWWLLLLEFLKHELELNGRWRVGIVLPIPLGEKTFSHSGVSRAFWHYFRDNVVEKMGAAEAHSWLCVPSRGNRLFTLSESSTVLDFSPMGWH